jgi:hypothetical protein
MDGRIKSGHDGLWFSRERGAWARILLGREERFLKAEIRERLAAQDNRRASAIAMAIFATGVAVSVLLIATHNRPFVGEISVGPEPLLQVLPR